MSALLSEASPGTGWWPHMLAEGRCHHCQELTWRGGWTTTLETVSF